MHACWNAVTKAVHDRVIVFGWIGTVSLVSGGVALLLLGLPGRFAVTLACISAVIHLLYYLGLMRAYRLGAFNQMYPVARGTSPLLVAAGAAVLASERLHALELSGIVVLASGLFVLAFTNGRYERSEGPALIAAVLTGVAIAAYSLVDGLGVRHATDPFSYMALSFLLEGALLVLLAGVTRGPAQWFTAGVPPRGLVAGAGSIVAYGAVMWAQTRAPLAVVSALRETGVISAAIIGAVAFHEGFGRRRVLAAVVVAMGIALIAV